jgi:hypothetical protein
MAEKTPATPMRSSALDTLQRRQPELWALLQQWSVRSKQKQ